MERPPLVALGRKSRGPTLGERVKAHFYNNRGTYLSALGAAGTVAAGVGAGIYGHRLGLERSAELVRQERRHGQGVAEYSYQQGVRQGTQDMLRMGFQGALHSPAIRRTGPLREAFARSASRGGSPGSSH